MKKLQKLVSALLCVCMLLSVSALAENADVAPEASAVTELAADVLVATVNGDELVWSQVQSAYNVLSAQYGAYFDLSLQENVDLLRAIAMDNVIIEKLLMQKAGEFGMAELSAEENADLEVQAASEWEAAIADYIAYYHPDLTEEASDEEKAAARSNAEAYYAEMGYDLSILTDEYKYYAVVSKVQDFMVQDAVVTDEEVEAYYQQLVAADKELYANDPAQYEEDKSYAEYMASYAMFYGTASDMDAPWYKPEGFRAVKHILLPVDEELMNNYVSLQARLEEQAAQEAAGEEAAAEETEQETAEPVTEAMVNEAKAAIFTSLADTIEQINTKINEGVDFDELIALYGVDAEGNPSDPGMVSEPYMTEGYEVSAASSTYVPEFVEAAMSIPEVGGVSAPYLSTYGVHIVKYLADVPGGPVEMTAEQREAKRATLLSEKQNELYVATVENWKQEATIEYTGVVPSYEQLLAEQDADAAATAE